MPIDCFTKSNIRIGILRYPDVLQSSVYGLQELFTVANKKRNSDRDKTWPNFELSLWCDPSLYRTGTSNHLHIGQDSPVLNLLIVPPAMGETIPKTVSVELKEWLHYQHNHGCILASACVGAFILASAGLLKQRTCTTHWGLAQQLGNIDPSIKLDPDKILIDDGDIITAGGVMAWMDLGFHVIHRFAGPKLIMYLSKFFIVDTGRREQRFYQDFSPNFSHGNKSIIELQHYLQQHFSQGITINDMAKISHMSSRNLQRRFIAATGLSPSVYIQRIRIEKAKEQLQTTLLGIDRIAWDIGYEDLSAFRKRFKQWVGLSPSAYRKRFQQVSDA